MLVLAVAEDAGLTGPFDIVETDLDALLRASQRQRDLERVESGAGIAPGHVDQVGEGLRIDGRPFGGERSLYDNDEVGLVEQTQAEHRRAADERGVDLEERVLRGRSDEGDDARLDC